MNIPDDPQTNKGRSGIPCNASLPGFALGTAFGGSYPLALTEGQVTLQTKERRVMQCMLHTQTGKYRYMIKQGFPVSELPCFSVSGTKLVL